MIEWERCGAAWGRAVAIKCDGCGTRKPMLTADALPCAWVVRNGPVPPGWGRTERADGTPQHWCKVCKNERRATEKP